MTEPTNGPGDRPAGFTPLPQVPRTSDPALLATGTLTALRVPPPRSVAAPVPGRAMVLAPLVGIIPGGAAALVYWLAGLVHLWVGVQAVLAIGALALATRGLHLDGLADLADGLAASYDRDRALAVMRSGDTGPAGMATVVLVLLLQCAALVQASAQLGAWAVLIAAVAGRVAVPLACVAGVPAARPEGLGALVSGSVSRFALVAVLVVTGLAAGALCVGAESEAWRGLLAVLLAALVSAVVVRRAVTRFGGITGDVIGGAVELATAAALLTLAAS